MSYDTITLPDASGLAGRPYIIKKVNNTSLVASITPYSGQTIEGESFYSLPYHNDAVILYSDGSNWKIYSRVYGQLTQTGITYLNDLIAGTATIDYTSAHITTLTSNNFTATTGTIGTLSSTTGHVTTLTTNNITATTGTVKTLESTTGHVSTLTTNNFTATTGTIGILSSTTGHVTTLTTNNFTATDLVVTNTSTLKTVTATLLTASTLKAGSSTNYTQFDNTGHQTMAGSARPWRDEVGELLTKKKVGLNITEDSAEGTVVFQDYCTIANDYVLINVQLNHDKDLSASIHPHLHWFQATALHPNWLFQYRWQSSCATKVATWLSLTATDTACTYPAGSGATIHQISHSTPITPPANSHLSDIVQFRVCRDTANDSTLFGITDPVAGNVHALMFDCHFLLNSQGSNDEYTK